VLAFIPESGRKKGKNGFMPGLRGWGLSIRLNYCGFIIMEGWENVIMTSSWTEDK
jgi:hypothetical protein